MPSFCVLTAYLLLFMLYLFSERIMPNIMQCNLPNELDEASYALVELLGPIPLDAKASASERLRQFVAQLALLADRSGHELDDPSWKSSCLLHPLESATAFLQSAYPSSPLPRFQPDLDQAVLVVPGGHLNRVQTRLTIAIDAHESLTSYDFHVPMVVNVLGFRPLSGEERLNINQIQHIHPLHSLTEESMWAALFSERCKKALPSATLETIHSGIYEALYTPKGSKKLNRSTTFDNAGRLALWAIDKLNGGFIQPTTPLVLCIEEPFSQRMLLIFKTILSWYIPNPVVVYHGKNYNPLLLAHERTRHLADLSVPINQLYLRLKLWHEIITSNFCEPRPSITSLIDRHPKK